MNKDESPIARRQRRNNEQQAKWLARQSQELRDRICVENALIQQIPLKIETYHSDRLLSTLNDNEDILVKPSTH